MPIRPIQEFGEANTDPISADYPSGSYKNETVPNVSQDGTPVTAKILNDKLGADEALYADVGITPTNVADTAQNSQKLDALRLLAGKTALRPVLIAQGLTGEYGYFSKGFTINDANDAGVTDSGQMWKYVGSDPLPLVVAAGTVPSAPDWLPFELDHTYQRTNTIDRYDVLKSNGDNSPQLNTMLSEQRHAYFDFIDGDIYSFSDPIQLRSLTKLSGSNKGATRQGDNIEFYNGLKKTTNNTVTITNPELPSQTVDCMLFVNGEWEDGIYPQKVKIEDISLISDAPNPIETCFYIIQGGNCSITDVDIYDFEYAIRGDQIWSCKIEKLVTNSLVRLTGGTSVTMNQCASGGTGNNGTTTGGFWMEYMLYSSMTGCSSDAGNRTAYYFNGCIGIVLNACGSEYINATNGNDNTGTAFHCLSSKITLNEFIVAANNNGNKPIIGVESNSYINFIGGSARFNSSESSNNYDVVISGDNSTVTFTNFQFSSGSFSTPKIRIPNGVNNSSVIVTDKDGITRRFYTEGDGVIITEIINQPDSGSNNNGDYVKFADGTAILTHKIPKTAFLNSGAPLVTTVQGIDYYKSPVTSWTYPIPLLSGTVADNVTLTPYTSTTGVRFVNARVTSSGESNTRTGEIQLISVEDFTSGNNGYENLEYVLVSAKGRWK
jgi:hypothetical protein